ncbi:MAG: sdhD [Rhodospirillales bacterium]|jgi:succinate dehydrogenase / fumarate reductase membrane anchor subunit|nr:sdhD [Rhodospirillales bacterium]
MVDLRSDLARARGLGSAKDGVHHWWVQRLSAVALVPLGIWFVVSAIKLAGVPLDAYRAWLNTGANVFLMVLFVATLFYHLKLGLQVVIEDYVHNEKTKVVSLMLNTFANIFVGAFSIFALVKVAFGG